MKLFKSTAMVCAAVGLGACTTATTTATTPVSVASSIGTAQFAGGSYTLTQNGTTRALGAPGLQVAGIDYSFTPSTGRSVYASGYHTPDVTAIAGMDASAPYATFAGISGTASTTVPKAGGGFLRGRFAVTYRTGGSTYTPTGAFHAFPDFNKGHLIGSGSANGGSAYGSLTFAATINGSQINGTADFAATATGFSATKVPMKAGFYGANTVAGVVQNSQLAGVFYAK